jgi:hypothetical protein
MSDESSDKKQLPIDVDPAVRREFVKAIAAAALKDAMRRYHEEHGAEQQNDDEPPMDTERRK